MSPIFKAVMFDMDGLLLDSEAMGRDTFVSTGEHFGLQSKLDLEAVYLSFVGMRYEDGKGILFDSIGDLVDMAEFSSRWNKAMQAKIREGIPLKRGAHELISTLQLQGIPTGVATSSKTHQAQAHLSHAGLLPMFSYVVGGDQVSKGKPDPESYVLLAEKLGVSASDCVVFEDSDTGTRAAVASGAVVVQVPDLKMPSDECLALGHQVAGDLLSGAELVGLLES